MAAQFSELINEPGLFDAALHWRMVGPYRGGRVMAVAGHPHDPMTFYFGSTGGGVFSTTAATCGCRRCMLASTLSFVYSGRKKPVKTARAPPMTAMVRTAVIAA